MKQLIQMKSSESKQPSNQEALPQFVCAIYIKDGIQKVSWNLIGDFPKNQVLPGLLAIAQNYKLNLLDQLQPNNDNNDELVDLLGHIVKTTPESDEVAPVSDKILTLHTLPTEESKE